LFLKSKIDLIRQVSIWSWLGRVAPLSALTILCFVIFLDFSGWVDYVICAVAVAFAIVAFTWWWWVIYAVRELNKMLDKTTDKFEVVIKEIKELKKDIKK
tara:strand:- start:3095 stop:3394 length:300 start_codon:yes stop_codon:yes gene_type:complete